MQAEAEQIATLVVRSIELRVAWIGFLGVLVGAFFGFLAAVIPIWMRERSERGKDEDRRKLLLRMLEDDRFPNRWRSLDTLRHVIGTDSETTKRLLLEVGARASEDGKDLWGLLKYHPLAELES